DTLYAARLDPEAFSADDVYYLRVVAENIWGNTALLGPYKSIKFAKNGYSEDRPGKVIDKFYVDNNPFSPNSDGLRDITVFNYRLSVAADISLKIFDAAGNIVFKADLGRQAGGTYHSKEWNGRDLNNNLVKNGLYYYKIAARSTDGKDDKIIQVIGVIK
ncbi:MAG: gliding motility-associated C-terminal domain-containing protein, partial [bacterium]|nr:gliding motility-associated C-terminal domain-containing protein [bacterium]